jgi:hypothetical protein
VRNRTAPAIFAAALGGAVLVAIAIGFAVIGSPGQIRIRRLDEQRVSELRSLTYAINGYRRIHHRLPDSLDEVARSGTVLTMRLGPYEYRLKGAVTYELCADFDASSGGFPRPAGRLDPWAHGKGHVCFTRE